jgi:hypothetical protein
MARREMDVVISDEGRDKGKLFHLTEMPSTQGEDMALRVFLALAKAGVDVPEEIQDAGFAGLVSWGVRSLTGVPFDEAKAVKDELFRSCVQYVPDPQHPEVRRGKGLLSVGPLVESDIEEVATRILLYRKLITLHTGFFSDAVDSTSPTAQPTAGNGHGTKTSLALSARSFPPG